MVTKKISVILPCYYASEFIGNVVERIKRTINKNGNYNYEIILVNDSPNDQKTRIAIDALCKQDNQILGIHLAKNFGQDIARVTGFHYATGDIVLNMDDDGQHPPEEMFKLVDKLEEGYDIVYANFIDNKHSFGRKVTSHLNSKTMEFVGNKKEGVALSSYCAFSKLCADKLKEYKSPFPIISSYLLQVTDNITDVLICHDERIAGKSGYSFFKRLKLELSVLTSFSVKPLRVSAILGFLFAAAGFILAISTVVTRILNPAMNAGYASIFSAILVIGGIILIILGLIGEYLGRMYMIINNCPQFVVRRVNNCDKKR